MPQVNIVSNDRNQQSVKALQFVLYSQYETFVNCENPENIQQGSEDAETVQTGCENASLTQSVAYHMVNRRYSEFLNLQTRLEEKNELRKLIKGTWDRLLSSSHLSTWFSHKGLFWNYRFEVICACRWSFTNLNCFRCERSKENFSWHAIWKHGQWQNRGQERAPWDVSKSWLILLFKHTVFIFVGPL